MRLEENKLYLTESELKLVRKYNWMASPFNAGLFLYNALKKKNTDLVWDSIYYKDIYLAYRGKRYEIVEDSICEDGKLND